MSKVQTHLPSSLARAPGFATQAKLTGLRNGVQMTPIAKPAQHLIPSSTEPALPTVHKQRASNVRPVPEPQFRPVPPVETLQKAEIQGVTKQAVKIDAAAGFRAHVASVQGRAAGNRNAVGRREPSKSGKARYASSNYFAGLEGDEEKDESEFIAGLVPVREHQESAEDLAKYLRHAVSDPDSEEFEHFCEDILAGVDPSDEDADRLIRKLKDSRVDDGEVMEELRKFLKIPSLNRDLSPLERDSLRQRIQDEIREFESNSTGEGRAVLTQFNAANAAAGIENVDAFLNIYTELVTNEHTLIEAMRLLTKSGFPMQALMRLVSYLKKALSDDLSAATPSHDKYRLGHVNKQLQEMNVMSTAIDQSTDLAGLMNRTFYAAAAA